MVMRTYNDIYIDARKVLKAAAGEGTPEEINAAVSTEARLLLAFAAEKTVSEFVRDMRLYTTPDYEKKAMALIPPTSTAKMSLSKSMPQVMLTLQLLMAKLSMSKFLKELQPQPPLLQLLPAKAKKSNLRFPVLLPKSLLPKVQKLQQAK